MEKNSRENGALWIAGGIAAMVVIAAWIANWFALERFGYDPATAGQFGDRFGAVNALFSGLAVIGLVIAIWLQRQEIRTAREELRATKKMIDDQSKTIAKQQEALDTENFERKFFQLVAIFEKNAESVSYDEESGRSAFEWMVHSVNTSLAFEGNVDEMLKAEWREIFTRSWSSLGPFFGSVFNAVRYIENAPQNSRDFYMSILRTQITNFQATVLVMYCSSIFGDEHYDTLLTTGIQKNMFVDPREQIGQLYSFYPRRNTDDF